MGAGAHFPEARPLRARGPVCLGTLCLACALRSRARRVRDTRGCWGSPGLASLWVPLA